MNFGYYLLTEGADEERRREIEATLSAPPAQVRRSRAGIMSLVGGDVRRVSHG